VGRGRGSGGEGRVSRGEDDICECIKLKMNKIIIN
jgi:hypothetical protein